MAHRLIRIAFVLLLPLASSFGATVAQMSGTVFPPPEPAANPQRGILLAVIAIVIAALGGVGVLRGSRDVDTSA